MSPSVDDYLSRVQAAGSTPGPWAPAGQSQKPIPLVYMGSRGRSIRVPVGPATPAFRGGASSPSSARMDFDGPRLKRSKQETAPGVGYEDDIIEADVARSMVAEWWGTPAFDRWGDHLVDLGLIDKEDARNFEVLDEAWQDAVGLASRFGPSKRISPWEAARIMAEADTSGGGRGRYAKQKPFSGTKRHTSTQVDLTDPATAKALVNDVLSEALGRRPNDEELEQFRNVLNAAERSNPTTTTTTSQFVDGEQVSSSSVTSGGLGAAGRAQLMEDQAMQLPEYGAFQAAGHIINWLFDSLGTVGGN